jgi:hypothetical protein
MAAIIANSCLTIFKQSSGMYLSWSAKWNYLLIPPEVLFNVTMFPKVFPPSLLVRITGFDIRPVLFVSHIIATLLPDALTLTLSFKTNAFGFVLGVLPTSIVFVNVFPPS